MLPSPLKPFFLLPGSTASECLWYDVTQFCHQSSLTSKPIVHHPAMDTLVLSLQSGKAAAVFFISKHRDSSRSVVKFENVVVMWFQVFGFAVSHTVAEFFELLLRP